MISHYHGRIVNDLVVAVLRLVVFWDKEVTSIIVTKSLCRLEFVATLISSKFATR